MQLVFEAGRSRWEAVTKFGEGDVPKAAGMRWDRDRSRWHTTDARIAIKLRKHADEATQARLEAAAVEAQEAVKAKEAAADVARVLSRATDAEVEIPAPKGLSYLGYQRAGIAYSIQRPATLLADEPGLGKTIQALGVANCMAAEAGRPVKMLVVAPKISLWNWKREAEKWLVVPHSVAIWTAKRQPAADVVILNYDILTRAPVAQALRAAEWDLAVFDEAHALKNPDAARTRAVLGHRKAKQEPLAARRRLFLTGTPILNRPVELFPLLNSMGVEEARSFFSFAKRFCGAYDSGYGLVSSGATNLAELQDVLRRGVMVRRLKADVLTELPAKRYSVLELEADTPELRKAVAAEVSAKAKADAETKKLAAAVAAARKGGDAAALKDAVSKLSAGKRAAFTEISKLRHATAVAKVPQVVEHVAGLLENSEESILVMAHHKDVIEGIVAGLQQAGHGFAAVITGETNDQDRQRVQDDIQSKRKRVFIGSMRACGVAITLHAASTVVFAEQDWTPGIMHQAEDRAHRIGQKSSVLVQHLVVDGSIDSTMAKAVADKGGVIQAAVDDEEDEDAAAAWAAEQEEIETRIAAAVAEAEAEVEARRRAQEERQAHRATQAEKWQATIAAERQERRVAATERAAARVIDGLGQDLVIPEAQAGAILECLRRLADDDRDRASERNGVGFSGSDTVAGHYLAEKSALSGREALVGLWLVRRYRGQLPSSLVAAALGVAPAPSADQAPYPWEAPSSEPAPAVEEAPRDEQESAPAEAPAPAQEPVPVWATVPEQLDLVDYIARMGAPDTVMTPAPADELALAEQAAELVAETLPAAEPVPRWEGGRDAQAPRRRGRPPKGERTMSAAERTRAWKQRNSAVSVQMPGDVAERLRAMRDARGVTLADLLRAAVDALESKAA